MFQQLLERELGNEHLGFRPLYTLANYSFTRRRRLVGSYMPIPVYTLTVARHNPLRARKQNPCKLRNSSLSSRPLQPIANPKRFLAPYIAANAH